MLKNGMEVIKDRDGRPIPKVTCAAAAHKQHMAEMQNRVAQRLESQREIVLELFDELERAGVPGRGPDEAVGETFEWRFSHPIDSKVYVTFCGKEIYHRHQQFRPDKKIYSTAFKVHETDLDSETLRLIHETMDQMLNWTRAGKRRTQYDRLNEVAEEDDDE